MICVINRDGIQVKRRAQVQITGITFNQDNLFYRIDSIGYICTTFAFNNNIVATVSFLPSPLILGETKNPRSFSSRSLTFNWV